MGMLGPNSAAAELACRKYQMQEDADRRLAREAQRQATPETVSANPEANTVRTPMAVRAETGNQATGLVETATTSHGVGARLKKAWASVTGGFTRPSTTPEE